MIDIQHHRWILNCLKLYLKIQAAKVEKSIGQFFITVIIIIYLFIHIFFTLICKISSLYIPYRDFFFFLNRSWFKVHCPEFQLKINGNRHIFEIGLIIAPHFEPSTPTPWFVIYNGNFEKNPRINNIELSIYKFNKRLGFLFSDPNHYMIMISNYNALNASSLSLSLSVLHMI